MNRLPPSFSYPAGDSNPYGLSGQLILSQSRLPFRHPGNEGYCATMPVSSPKPLVAR